MLLHCNYEELTALKFGAEVVLGPEHEGSAAVAAPPEERAYVAALVSRLEGDLAIETLAEQRQVAQAVEVIVGCLRSEMDAAVAAAHPADESAVAAYFDYAHAYAVLDRIREMGSEMTALIELVTGEPPTEEVAGSFVFPD